MLCRVCRLSGRKQNFRATWAAGDRELAVRKGICNRKNLARLQLDVGATIWPAVFVKKNRVNSAAKLIDRSR